MRGVLGNWQSYRDGGSAPTEMTKMEYKGYLSRVEFDDEAGIFHGEVINIRDVITFQGKTVDELRQAFEDSVEDYLAFCAERGEEPNQPFSGRFTLCLPPEQYRQVILAAEKVGKGVQVWAAEALTQTTSARTGSIAGRAA